MAVARDYRPGHIGNTPQDTDAIVAGGRVAGMLHDLGEHYVPPETDRVDAFMGLPAVSEAAAAHPERVAWDITAAGIGGAVSRSQQGGKTWPDAKHLGGFDYDTDA